MKKRKGEVSILVWIALFALGLLALLIFYAVFVVGIKNAATFFSGKSCEPATGENCNEEACNTYGNLEWDKENSRCVPIKGIT